MNSKTETGTAASFRRFSKTSCVAVTIMGLMVLIGWIFDSPMLRNIQPDTISMQANTAIGLILAGISLWLQQSQPPGPWELRIIKVCTGAVILLGFLTLCEYLFGRDLGIDQLFIREYPGAVGTTNPGRMAPNTALCFLLLGLSLRYLDTETAGGKRPAQFLVIASLLISMSAFYGDLFDVSALFELASYTRMAPYTMVAFNVLSFGILCARPEHGIVEMVASREAGGVMTRRLLTASFVVPTLLGWLIAKGEGAHLLDVELGLSIFLPLIVGFFAALSWRNGVVMDQANKESKAFQAEKRVFLYARSLIEASLDPLVTISPQGQILDVNEATVKVTGVPRERLIGTDFSGYFTDPDKAQSGYQQVFRDGFVRDYELELYHSDGHLTSVLYNASVYRDEEGEVAGVFAAVRDFTERKLTEEKLQASLHSLKEEMAERQKSEEKLRLLIDAAKDYAIIMLDVDGRVASWNDGARRLKGWEAEEILGRHLSLFYPEEAAAAGHPDHELEIAAAEGRYAEEGWRMRKDGSKFMADVTITAIRDESGKLRGFSKITRDITERKRSEELQGAKEVAETANQVKSQFLANMSHELRTPMTGVLGMLDLVLTGNLEAEQREFISVARTSARSMVRILNDILTLTKIEHGKLSIEAAPFSVRECVEDTLNILLPVAKGKGIEIDFLVADDVPEIMIGDRLRINQVLTNLADNALKFTGKGKVELRVAAAGSALGDTREVTFTVTDTGIGIPDDKKHILFHAFSQVDESHSREYGGTGLGLAISKEIVERMGGTISFTSEEDKGSVFSFTIPLGEAKPLHEVALPQRKTETATDGVLRSEEVKKPRLVVAEDDPIIRQVLGSMLRRSNFEIDFAEDGQKVVEMWENGEYDLILMDVQMPRMNGFKATGAIRAKERTRGGHTPIVAMTAYALKEDEERCLDAGMDAYISKPIDFEQTLQVIRETLKKPVGVDKD